MSRHQIYRNSCVACGSQDVAIVCLIDAEQQDPKIRSHTVLVECKKCHRAQVEKLAYDAYDWAQATDRYAWYVLDLHDKFRLAGMLEHCPHPLWAACHCSIHDALRSSCSSLPVPRADPADSSWHIYRVRLEPGEPVPKLTLLETGGLAPTSRAGSDTPKLVAQLSQAIQFLMALKAQLLGDTDPATSLTDVYGRLVPEETWPGDLDGLEQARLSEELRDRDHMNAFSLDMGIRAIRDLLERHERSRVAPRILNWYAGTPFLYEETMKARLYRMGLPQDEIEKAVDIAKTVHSEQRRDDGSFYPEEHIYPLAYEVARYLLLQQTDGQLVLEATLIAILHDTLEDCHEHGSMDCDEVRRRIESSFGLEMVRHIETLTKLPKSQFAHLPEADARIERQEEYFGRISRAPYAVKLVKVMDRINNLQCVHKSPSKIPGYIEETARFHTRLAADVDSVLVEHMAYVIQQLQAKLEDLELERDEAPGDENGNQETA